MCPSDHAEQDVMTYDTDGWNDSFVDANGDVQLWLMEREGDASYIYIGWAIEDNRWVTDGSANIEFAVIAVLGIFAKALGMAGVAGVDMGNPDDDYTIDDHPHPDIGEVTLYRFREGIERFFITDINNPAGSAQAQSELAVMWDEVSVQANAFNHVPGGCNVLFMDGHVEFIRYPSEEFPVTPETAWIFQKGAEML